MFFSGYSCLDFVRWLQSIHLKSNLKKKQIMIETLDSSQLGASLVLATSSDEDYPPENILDGKTDTFWVTTGQFPQEFVISFKSIISISRIKIFCYNVLDLEIEQSLQNFLDCEKWYPLAKERFVHHEGHITEKEFLVNTKAQHLRFIITAGHDNFACVYNVGIITNS